MKLKPYPEYKDSGVPWLGKVPVHWEIERLKSLMSNIIQQTTERQSSDLYVALEHVESWTGRFRQVGSEVLFDSQVKRFRSGDVLFGKLRPYLAKVTRPTSDGVCVGEFLVLRPRVFNVTAPYMEQLLRSKPIIDAINSSTFGAKMPRADWQFVGGMAVALPPLPEQSTIVRYLDHIDRRIQRYIRAKRRLVALLNEQKHAIIHRAVTRGLDPNMRLKPSGVEWLGDVPEHWEVMPLRRVTLRRCDGPFGSGLKSSHYTDHGVRVVRLQNIGHGEFRNGDAAFISPEHYATLGDHDVVAGDVLIAGLGDEGHPAGRACIAPCDIEPAMVKADCFRFRLERSRIIPQFAAFHLTATSNTAAAILSTGATRQRINLQSMSARGVAIPPLGEQARIVAFIAEATDQVVKAITKTEREINLICEYRTRLIADVVTGKLDVRGVDLPELEEAEALEELNEETATEDEHLDSDNDDEDLAAEV